MDITKIGAQIAVLRKEKGVKQEDVANAVGVTPQAVSKWENGGVPDTELIPKIADYFGVSTDILFGRSLSDYGDLHAALIRKVFETPEEDRFKTVFEFCWDIECGMFGEIIDDDRLSDYAEEIGPDEQVYSSIMTDYGFIRMGIASKRSYFLLVPEVKDTEVAFFDGIDYPAFFQDFAARDVFDTCVWLHRREGNKAFTPGLLVKNMGISFERAEEILTLFKKYRLIDITHIELDDATQEVYTFRPTPSFTALLIFAREMIDPPNHFAYYSGRRKKPYFQ